MDLKQEQPIDRLIIINGKWNTIHQSDGEVIPKLMIGTTEAKDKEYKQFFTDLEIACTRLDRVIDSMTNDRILRLNLVIYNFPEADRIQMETEICEEIKRFLPKVRECLHFTHTTDRELLPREGAQILRSFSNMVFRGFGKGTGVIYGEYGGIIGGAQYANDEPGPAEWDYQEKYYRLDANRFNFVWETYFRTIKDWVHKLRRQFRILQAYGGNSWIETSLGKRIGNEIEEFEKFIKAEASALKNGDTTGKDYKVIFQDIKAGLPDISGALKNLAQDKNLKDNSWETINNYINIWTEKTN